MAGSDFGVGLRPFLDGVTALSYALVAMHVLGVSGWRIGRFGRFRPIGQFWDRLERAFAWLGRRYGLRVCGVDLTPFVFVLAIEFVRREGQRWL